MKHSERSGGRKRRRVARPAIVLALLFLANGAAVEADEQEAAQTQTAGSVPRLIQGRITNIQGSVLLVKTPDGYPGATGNHAMFVVSGPLVKVDISGARIVLPDGLQADTRPLNVGDRVAVGLYEPAADAESINHAFIVERLVLGDKAVTH